jgi:hypothetical protein
MLHHLRRIAVLAVAIALGACASSAPVTPSSVVPFRPAGTQAQALSPELGPFVISMNARTGELELWPLRKGGGSHPKPLSAPLGLGSAVGLATKGHVIAIASQNPSQLSLYSMNDHSLRTFADPFGAATDVAIGIDGTFYVNNVPKSGSSVTMYQPPAHRPVQLVCAALSFSTAVAVDNENNIYLQGYGTGGSSIVAEIPNGPGGPEPQNCATLPLKTDGGYGAGIVVDPTTDDLVTLDDPDYCAGGIEGRMTVYPKPYNINTGKSRVLGFECAGGLRLSADSKYVYLSDTNLTISFILQRTFPDGGDVGRYRGGDWSGFTTIPSSLPN